jgi:hypothetical protein
VLPEDLNELNTFEKDLAKKTHCQYKKFLTALDDFKINRHQKYLLDNSEQELINSNRLIKNEVIDIADMVEGIRQDMDALMKHHNV